MTFRTLLVASAVAAVSAAANAQAQIHTPNDHIPNFAASPTIRSAVNGSWSSPATWTPARLPAASDIVSVAHAVTIVYTYQGQAGNNFRVYFAEQATQPLYGGVAPCGDTTTRPEIEGITCGMISGLTPPTGLRIVP